MNKISTCNFFGINKVGKIMATVVAMLVWIPSVAVASDYPGTTKLSISAKNEALESVLRRIEKQSEYLFFYQSDKINKNDRVTIEKKDVTVYEIMDEISRDRNIDYAVNDRHVVLTFRKEAAKSVDAVSGPIRQVQTGRTVSGNVVDQTGEPVIGASIVLQGSSNVAITDTNGRFMIEAPETGVLTVAHLSYVPREISIEGRASITIVLTENQVMLNDIVVVAYGVQRKTTMTGSVGNVRGEELSKSITANISNTMAGRLSGVSMRPSSGKPGEDNPTIYIRGIGTTGNSNPLIVIDGVVRDNINQINMNDIESVSVLKDAAAVAPYGLGGANGVLLITTKSGKEGATSLRLNAYYGLQTPTITPKMLNATDYMTLRNEAYMNDNNGVIPAGGELPFARDLIADYANLHKQDPDKYPDSNFYGEMVNLNTQVMNYNLQLDGGTALARYYIGLGYFDQQGMYDALYYKRYSISGKLDVQALKYTKVALSFNGSVEKRNTSPQPTAISYMPIRSLYYSNGLWGESGGYSPVGDLESGSYNRINNNTMLLSLSVEQQLPFITGLSMKGLFSYDPDFSYEKSWSKPHYYYLLDTTTTPYTYTRTVGGEPITTLRQQDNKNERITGQFHLNYARTFGKHDVGALAVFEVRDANSYWMWTERRKYQVDIDEMDMGSSDKTNFDNGGSSSQVKQAGLVYRVNYAYDSKYMFEASGRYDGHSYFAPDKRWAFFPAFSAGWRISEEPFMKDIDWLYNLKLRASWGESGNLATGAFQYLSAYTLFNNAHMWGNTIVQGSRVSQEANPNITWERSRSANIGLDASFFNGMLTFEFDLFQQKRNGMLLSPNITVPVEYGLGLAQENAGIMTNRGFEFQIGGNHTFANGLKLHMSGNFSYAKNEMDQVFESLDTYNSPNRRRTGRAYQTPFGYLADGLFSTSDDKNGDGIVNADDGYTVKQFGAILHPGDVRYKDIGGPDGTPDGTIDAWDETEVGYPYYPRITYGFTLAAEWKGFDLSAFFQGAAQASLNLQGYMTLPFRLNNTNVSYEYFDNYWTPERQSATYPRITQSPYQNNTTNSQYSNGFGPYSSSFWMRTTNYLRLKNVVLGYTLPDNVSRKIGMNALRLYVAGTNPLTFSKIDFIDPEADYSSREEAYPLQKSWTMGLDITF